jgi:hypothetical protein
MCDLHVAKTVTSHSMHVYTCIFFDNFDCIVYNFYFDIVRVTMHNNPLFVFLSSLRALPVSMERKTTTTGTEYFLYTLPLPNPANMQLGTKEFIIKEQHISIYSHQDNRDPNLSQYHFTATLITPEGEQKIHVYFNRKDQCVKASMDVPYHDVPYHDASNPEELIEHAITASWRTIAELRKQRSEEIKRLNSQLANLSSCQDAQDITKINAILKTLRSLYTLEPLGKYGALIKYYLKFKKTVKDSLQVKTMEVEAETDDLGLYDKPIAWGPSVVSPKMPRKEEQPALSLDNIITLRTLLNNYTDESDRLKKPELFIRFHEQLMNADMLASDGDTSSEVVEALDMLHNDSNNIGEKLVLDLLLRHQPLTTSIQTQAKTLQYYLQPNSEKLFVMALKSGNYLLLEFVLEHSEITINTLLIDDTSPICFCLEHQYKDLTQQRACISILMKQGASTLVPAKDGLPIMFHMYTKHLHLRKTLLDNIEETLYNPSYARQFIRLLEMHKSHSNPSDATKAEMDAMINISQQAQALCKEYSSRSAARIARELSPVIEQISRSLKQEDIRRLQTDSAYLNLQNQCRLLNGQYIGLLNHQEKLQFHTKQRTVLVDIQKRLSQIDTSALSFEAFKRAGMEYLQATILWYQECINLKVLQNQGACRMFTRATQNKFVQEQRSIIARIAVLERQLIPQQQQDMEDRTEIALLRQMESLGRELEQFSKDLQRQGGLAPTP